MQQSKKRFELPKSSIRTLKNGKNLLAFSGGVDSSALFFILHFNDITFDIAIVNYNTRENSKLEEEYAKELAKEFQKKIFIKNVRLSPTNFEHTARKVRYEFFEKIIKEENYTNLITAHQLDDKLEWFLMQFTKGAGLSEILGLSQITKKEGYTLVRPLLEYTKEDLLAYLKQNGIKYFVDESNFSNKYKRNRFRKEFSAPLLKEYKEGIKKSFRYLQNDKNLLYKKPDIKRVKKLFIFDEYSEDLKNIRVIDELLKELGYVLSKSQRDEIIQKKDVVIADSFAVVFANKKVYISPFVTIKMDKKFKESCRVKKIPPKIRGYILKEDILSESL